MHSCLPVDDSTEAKADVTATIKNSSPTLSIAELVVAPVEQLCYLPMRTRSSAVAEIARVVPHRPYIAKNLTSLGYMSVVDSLGLASLV